MLVGLTLLAGAAAVGADAESQRTAGTLNMNASLRLVSILGPCPPGVSATGCAARTSRGPFAGLGQVTGTYTFLIDVGPPTCANGWGEAQAYPVRFAIASKGEIHFELAAGAQCVNEDQVFAAREQTQTFTVTAGTGIYASASGTGTVTRRLSTTDTGSAGTRRGPAPSPFRASSSTSPPRRLRERPTRRCEPSRARRVPGRPSRSPLRTALTALCPSDATRGPEAASH